MENEEKKIKKWVILGIILMLCLVFIAEASYSLVKKATPSKSLISQKVLPTLAPNGPLNISSKPKIINSGNFAVTIDDKGFSQKKVVVLEKGSSLLLINASSKTVEINETDANDKYLNFYKIEVGASSFPILKNKTGTYKYKDKNGNLLTVVIQ